MKGYDYARGASSASAVCSVILPRRVRVALPLCARMPRSPEAVYLPVQRSGAPSANMRKNPAGGPARCRGARQAKAGDAKICVHRNSMRRTRCRVCEGEWPGACSTAGDDARHYGSYVVMSAVYRQRCYQPGGAVNERSSTMSAIEARQCQTATNGAAWLENDRRAKACLLSISMNVPPSLRLRSTAS